MNEPDFPRRTGDTTALGVFLVFLRLGTTSFGGPVAHLAYFRDEFVARRRWLGDAAYADLVALCQFLPGPASSQVGIALGLSRAGFGGAVAAWVGFTLPSALALVALAIGTAAWEDVPSGLLRGLQAAALAVVARAVLDMARQLCVDAGKVAVAVISAAIAIAWSSPAMPIATMLVGALAGLAMRASGRPSPHEPFALPLGPRVASVLLALFVALLVGLPLLVATVPGEALRVVDAFYRAGALVFGGGHVVLPLLQSSVVANGWVPDTLFLAGYGATQAMPGPLFAFAAFLGAAMHVPWGPVTGAALCLVAIYLPSFLLVAGALPFWEALRRRPAVLATMGGVNAAVVGLLAAAWWHAVRLVPAFDVVDAALAVVAFVALTTRRVPPWAVVLACGGAGALLR